MFNLHFFSTSLLFLQWFLMQGVPAQVWQGCVDPEKPKNKIRVAQKTRVCFSISNTTNWSAGVAYTRASFEPQADVYSRFHIPNSYNDLVLRRNATSNVFSQSPVITVGASSQSALSFLKVYFDANKKQVFPFLTAIIEVEKGVVQFITWDDGCVFCGATECLENTYNFDGVPQNKSTAGQVTRSCVLTIDECNDLLRANSTSTACDLTFYVVWSGTDANGLALQSQAYRFSAFPPQDWSDRLSQLLIPDKAADFINENTARRSLTVDDMRGVDSVTVQNFAAATPLWPTEREKDGRDL